jgi:hypothetical protein
VDYLEASGPQFLIYVLCAVESTVPFKHRVHPSRDYCVLMGSWARVLQPLPPGVKPLWATPSCLHSQAVGKRLYSALFRRNLSTPAVLFKVRCRQPEKIFPPELTDVLTHPGLFSPLHPLELTRIGWTKITAVNPGLANPLGEGAVGDFQLLGHSRTAELLSESKGNSLSFLLRLEQASGPRRVGHR